MAGHWTDLYSFITGAIRRPDLGYLVLSNDEAAKAHIPMAGVVQWKPTGWGDGGTMNWRAAGAAMVRQPLEQLCLVGEFGQVLLVGSGDRHEEHVGGAAQALGDRGPLRGVRAIGQHVYCVGMDRQAHRRHSASGSWASFDTGLPPAAAGDVAGLEAIDGYSETDIYAVGWDGEIWQHDGQRWLERDSPVNTVLVDVCCAEDGWVYACGRNGVLIKGRNDRWSVVDIGGFPDDIWSLASYQGRLYLATMDYVLTLGQQSLDVVDMGADAAKTCYDLVADQGVLWSIGAKDVLSFDGTAWTRID
jgi:hypothetical protein